MDIESQELVALENEFQWVLDHEVKRSFKELATILNECMARFPMPVNNLDKVPTSEKFILNTPSTSPSEQVKVVVTLTGDKITQADINLKLPRPSGHKDFYQNTSIREDAPWGLQQIQDCSNHLRMASVELEATSNAKNLKTRFNSASEVTSFLTRFMGCIQRSRSALVNPKKRTLEELRNSKNVKGLVPVIPPELALSFYLQSWKLIFAVYHIVMDPKTNTSKFNRYQAEAVIPWVNDVVLYLTIALQTAQQLKDKINVFSQYHDFTPTYDRE